MNVRPAILKSYKRFKKRGCVRELALHVALKHGFAEASVYRTIRKMREAGELPQRFKPQDIIGNRQQNKKAQAQSLVAREQNKRLGTPSRHAKKQKKKGPCPLKQKRKGIKAAAISTADMKKSLDVAEIVREGLEMLGDDMIKAVAFRRALGLSVEQFGKVSELPEFENNQLPMETVGGTKFIAWGKEEVLAEFAEDSDYH